MFVAIVGTRCSGKTSVADYLVFSRGFTLVRLSSTDYEIGRSESSWDASSLRTEGPPAPELLTENPPSNSLHRISTADSFLSMNSPLTPYLTPSHGISTNTVPRDTSRRHGDTIWFSSADEMLDHCTRRWREKFVTMDLYHKGALEEFNIRPFFLLVSVDAPLMTRFERSKSVSETLLEDFVREHDRTFYGQSSPNEGEQMSQTSLSSLHRLQPLVNVHIVNAFESLDALYSHLDALDLVNPDRLRPTWDTYFMHLASLASLRSNCMKRRVGAILVRNSRIVATGYNGTPRGLRNCNEGGCARCNGSSPSGQALDECVCLHAEENALLEAGRERVGEGAVLYCNTCPCLRCTVKIIQTGVKEVVYNLSYKVDDASMALFKEAGVRLRRHAPPR